jgi:cytochrome c556
MSGQDMWRTEYARIARELVAAATKLGKMVEAPDAEPLNADQFEAALAEVDRLQKELQTHFWSHSRPGN